MPRTSTLLIDVTEALLERSTWPNRAEIARAVGTGQAALTPWLNYLEFFRVLRETGDGLEARRAPLLAILTAYRTANLRPERPMALRGDVHDVHDRLEAAGVAHLFGMFTSANQWAFYEAHRDVHVYLARSDRGAAVDALGDLLRDGRSRGGELQIYLENLDALGHAARGDLPVTSPLQTVVDLRAHPEGGAHADFLERNVLGWEREGAP